uniref:RNA ligase/cyclic nucleotide phosphodiesterase family protein n=1 Tax=Chenopodium quinoa TaxID=63459 RepID=A0A803MVD2_CHEQI
METQPHAYSVWAIPPEHVKKRLKKLMDTLRSEFGGPELVPHLTVVRAVTLTPEDALEKFRLACNGLKAYSVQASGISTGTCPYLLFDATPEVHRSNAMLLLPLA